MSAREKGRNNDYVFQPKPGNRLINPWTPTPLSCYFRELGLLFLSPDSGCRSSTTQTRLLGELRGSLWNAEIQENTSCSPCQALGYLLWLPPLPPIIETRVCFSSRWAPINKPCVCWSFACSFIFKMPITSAPISSGQFMPDPLPLTMVVLSKFCLYHFSAQLFLDKGQTYISYCPREG